MSDFNNELVIDLFKQRDELRAEVERLTTKVAQLYEGAEEQKQRIKRLEEAGDEMVQELINQFGKSRLAYQWCKEKEDYK